MPYLSILGLQSKNNIVTFEISKEAKNLNLGPKVPYLGIFRLEIENIIVIFEVSTFKFV